MEKSDWQEMKKKFKKVYDRSVKALKEGSEGARHVAEQTAHALQLEVDIYGLRHRVTKLSQRFGDSVHKLMGNGKVVVNAEIRKLSAELTNLKETLKKKESEMHRLHLTRTVKKSKVRK